MEFENSIFRKSQPFIQYLSEWSSFLDKNLMSDWADDQEDIDQDFTKVVRSKKQHNKNYKKIPHLEGIIKKWNIEKNYGFIKCKSVTNDIFCHGSCLIGKSKPCIGKKVHLQMKKGNRGYTATNVSCIV